MRNSDPERFLAIWAKPLNDDSPCGSDCCFTPEFEAIKAEVDKDESVHSNESTDWSIVARLADDFLDAKSKDLWIVAYKIYSIYKTDGLAPWPDAFAALTQLLNTWWDTLYPLPSRMQRRLAPFIWLHGRMEHCAESTRFLDASSETLQALREQCMALSLVLTARGGDGAPDFLRIFSSIDERFGEKAPANTFALEQRSSTEPVRPASTINSSLTEMDKDSRVPAPVLPQLVRNIIEHNRQLACHFLAADATDERAYRLHRAALWGTLLQPPHADAGGKTMLGSGVPMEREQMYSAAVDGKRYAEIMPQLEISAGRSPFWFNGHAMVVRCLEGMQATSAAACVREALAALLARFPELVTYKFQDNTPFASPDLPPKNWST